LQEDNTTYTYKYEQPEIQSNPAFNLLDTWRSPILPPASCLVLVNPVIDAQTGEEAQSRKNPCSDSEGAVAFTEQIQNAQAYQEKQTNNEGVQAIRFAVKEKPMALKTVLRPDVVVELLFLGV
jgi:hypothetical protein